MRLFLLIAGFFLILGLVTGCTMPPKTATNNTESPTSPMSASTPTPSATTSRPVSVSPTPVHPNTGSIVGHVVYLDGTPATGITVALFDLNAFMSRDMSTTNNNGDYHFDYVPAGKGYDIFTFTSLSSGRPDATVNVVDQQVTAVPTIITLREIDNILSGNLNTSNPSANVTLTSQPSFSWIAVPGASSYNVTILSLSNKTSTGSVRYNMVATTSDTNIMWTTLQSGNYELTVEAFNSQHTLIGIGHGWFAVKP